MTTITTKHTNDPLIQTLPPEQMYASLPNENCVVFTAVASEVTLGFGPGEEQTDLRTGDDW